MSSTESTVSTDVLRATAPTAPLVATLARAASRLRSIDALRGFVIVLMALDHVRAYFTAVRFDPLDLSQTTAALFMTRWITHLCAPTFVFLAGVSAYLMSRRMNRAELSRFLLTRGVWLIVLEFTVVQFGWAFNFRYEPGLIMQVIWAIGASMVVLAAIAHLRLATICALAVAMIAGHHLLDGIDPSSFGSWAPLWNIVHVKGQTPFAFVIYPLVPWIGVMALGFCAGRLFELDPVSRRRWLLTCSITALVAFVVLRASNVYGDPHAWTPQSSATLTVLSFLDVTKYPPSLLYVLVTLGIGTLLLTMLESAHERILDVLCTFGRVPLFVYVLHLYLAHLAAGIVAWASGHGTQVLGNLFMNLPDGWGYDLPGVYFAWALVMLTLYPACRWFARVKAQRRDWWLAYL
jgi:uncharacterized membrane protein